MHKRGGSIRTFPALYPPDHSRINVRLSTVSITRSTLAVVLYMMSTALLLDTNRTPLVRFGSGPVLRLYYMAFGTPGSPSVLGLHDSSVTSLGIQVRTEYSFTLLDPHSNEISEERRLVCTAPRTLNRDRAEVVVESASLHGQFYLCIDACHVSPSVARAAHLEAFFYTIRSWSLDDPWELPPALPRDNPYSRTRRVNRLPRVIVVTSSVTTDDVYPSAFSVISTPVQLRLGLRIELDDTIEPSPFAIAFIYGFHAFEQGWVELNTSCQLRRRAESSALPVRLIVPVTHVQLPLDVGLHYDSYRRELVGVLERSAIPRPLPIEYADVVDDATVGVSGKSKLIMSV